MITLHPHQDELRAKLRVALRSNRSVLAFSPTGSGKTVLAAALAQILFGAGKRVVFACHRVDLLKQTAATFEQFKIPFSYIAAGYHYNPYHRVFIASIPTLQNRLGKYPADYVFVDEAHLSASGGWSKTINHYKEAGARIIGLTGSPERLDGKPLGDVWDEMVLGPSTRWLIENGFLSKYRAFSPKGVDLTGVHTRGGDYVTSEIDDLMAGKAVLAGAVRHWRQYASGKRTIAFAPSIARAEQLAAEFRANGIAALAVDGNTPMEDRSRAFQGFADRQIDLLINCQLWIEGFDMAAQVGRPCTIECVLDYSPTQSLARHLQKHGRGLRKDDGDPHILLDLVGGFARLGLPDEEREWSLEGRAKKEREVEVAQCTECFASHPPAPRCPECGHEYPKLERSAGEGRVIDEIEGELEEIDVTALREQRKREQGKAKSLEDLIALATARGYKSPERWAAHIHTARAAKSRQYAGAGR